MGKEELCKPQVVLSKFLQHETTRSIATPPLSGWDASPSQGDLLYIPWSDQGYCYSPLNEMLVITGWLGLYTMKPPAHVRKERSKVPHEAVCSAISSRVRQNFGKKFALQGREENMQHVWYFLPCKANSLSFAATVRFRLSQINWSSYKIAWPTHVTSHKKIVNDRPTLTPFVGLRLRRIGAFCRFLLAQACLWGICLFCMILLEVSCRY